MSVRKYLWLWALPLALICYAIGAEKGVLALLIVGAFLEGAFWLGLFKRTKKKQNKS
ncbi:MULTISPECIES: hypothetical protein [unclassified Pseudoalteromonas]|uniref:hypothetical protein n=1 Tax=unclassified Pseudoalteromonas TaxID=194690 RepID=UPI0018F87242|nr:MULTISPECIES: hypothetical protein [unclassified Pseudoalteromonas]